MIKRIGSTVCCILAITFLLNCPLAGADEYKHFDEYNLTFSYTPDWRIKDVFGTYADGNVTLYRGDVYNGAIYTSFITVKWGGMFSGLDPEYVLDLYVRSYQQDSSYYQVEVVDDSPTVVDGENAARRILRARNPDGENITIRNIGFTSIRSNRWIYMSYNTREAIDDEAGFNEVAETFRDTT